MAYYAEIYKQTSLEKAVLEKEHELELTTEIMFHLRELSYLVFVLVLS